MLSLFECLYARVLEGDFNAVRHMTHRSMTDSLPLDIGFGSTFVDFSVLSQVTAGFVNGGIDDQDIEKRPSLSKLLVKMQSDHLPTDMSQCFALWK